MGEKRIAILGSPFSFAFYCLPVFRIVDTARIGSLSSRAYGYGIGCIYSLNEREREREREGGERYHSSAIEKRIFSLKILLDR